MARISWIAFLGLLAAPFAAAQSGEDAAIADERQRLRAAMEVSNYPDNIGRSKFVVRDACTTEYLYVTDWAKVRSLDFVPAKPGSDRAHVRITSVGGGYGMQPALPAQVGPMLTAANDLMRLCKARAARSSGGAQAAVATAASQACPANLAGLDKLLASRRVLTSRAETPAVAHGSLVMGGYAGAKTYDPTGLRVLGVAPTAIEASIINGKPYSMTIMLPGHATKPYEGAFRAAYPGGRTECDRGGCSWSPQDATFDLPAGTLTRASLSLIIFSKTDTAFGCSYR
jgi:hypothetical protein